MRQVCKIILVRHGESVNNARHIVAGDSPLTDKGREQARATKAELAGFKFDSAYSSDLRRAVETAEIIYGQKIPTSHQLSGLRERDFGSIDSHPSWHHAVDHKERLTMTQPQSWVYKYVPDMESDDEVSARFVAALRGLGEKHAGKTILVAAHGAAIRTTLMRLHGLTYKQIPHGSYANGGYVELAYADNKFEVVRIVGLQATDVSK
jgi:broad specificity phosphatase PhoE